MEGDAYIPAGVDELARQYLIAMLPCHWALCVAKATREINSRNAAKGKTVPALLVAGPVASVPATRSVGMDSGRVENHAQAKV